MRLEHKGVQCSLLSLEQSEKLEEQFRDTVKLNSTLAEELGAAKKEIEILKGRLKEFEVSQGQGPIHSRRNFPQPLVHTQCARRCLTLHLHDAAQQMETTVAKQCFTQQAEAAAEGNNGGDSHCKQRHPVWIDDF